MNRCAAIALGLVLAGCNSGSKDKKDADSKNPAPPSPAGKWELRSAPAAPYLFTRYEFRDDHSFTRETGTSSGVVTKRISGSWSTSGQAAPNYSTGASLTDDMLRGAGVAPVNTDRTAGSLVLRYTVKSKSEIEVGATLVAERGPIMELDKRTFDLEEHHSLVLTKSDDKEWLSIGTLRFSKLP
jgi:hypothetical protein